MKNILPDKTTHSLASHREVLAGRPDVAIVAKDHRLLHLVWNQYHGGEEGFDKKIIVMRSDHGGDEQGGDH